MVLMPYPEDMLMQHPEPGFDGLPGVQALPHQAGMDMMSHPMPRGRWGAVRNHHDSSFMMGMLGGGANMVGNSMGGKGGGMMGGAMGGAAGAFGTYMLCKKMKGCTQKCMSAPPDCSGCLDMCAKLSAAGAAAGGAAGSGLGQKFMPGSAGAGGAGAMAKPGFGQLSILDEWNTAPAFALLQKMGPPGVDRGVCRQEKQSRHAAFFDLEVSPEVQQARAT